MARIGAIVLGIVCLALGAAAVYYYRASEGLAVQLKESLAKVASLQSQIQDTEVKLRDEGNKLASARSHIQDTEVKLRDEGDKLASARSHIEAQQQKLASTTAVLRQPPVQVRFRKAVMETGLVAVITPTSNRTVPFRVTMRRPSTGASRDLDLVLPALGPSGAIKEIGHMEGWNFIAGDELVLHNENFDDFKVTAAE